MTPATSAPNTNQAPKTVNPLIPPDERFWQRHSPHHEFPLSAMASFALHALALMAIIVGVYVVAKFGFSNTRPVSVEPVQVVPGGNGSPAGDKGGDIPPKELGGAREGESPVVPPSVPLKDLPKVQVAPNQMPELQGSDEGREILKIGAQTLAGLAKLDDTARRQMMDGLVTGRDGRKGRGVDEGEGDDIGAGKPKGKITVREKRVLRWTMVFNTNDGADYLRQLAALNAYIAVPEGGGQYRIFRNLSRRPLKGEIADLKTIDRIFWVDAKPDSVRSLATAMGLPEQPVHIVAFFPQELETELLRKELNWRGLREEQIGETRFQVVRRRTGYEAMVADQVPAQAQR